MPQSDGTARPSQCVHVWGRAPQIDEAARPLAKNPSLGKSIRRCNRDSRVREEQS